jgi:uncharacterized membrane protein
MRPVATDSLGHSAPDSMSGRVVEVSENFPGHSHSHSHDAPAAVTPKIRRRIAQAVIACAVLTMVGVIALWPSGRGIADDPLELNAAPVPATVRSVETGPCSGTSAEDAIECGFASIDVGSGSQRQFGILEQGLSSSGLSVNKGDRILVNAVELPDGTVSYSFFDFQRNTPLALLIVVFVAAVVLLGGWRGLGAIGGLIASLLVIAMFMLPSILDGNSPVLVALVGSSVVAFLALHLAHGRSVTTSVALLGTFGSLAVTGVLSWVFIAACKFTGFTDDATFFLAAVGVEIDARGILLAGFVIGALGVLDDVTVTQVSAVWELRRTQPHASDADIMQSALVIGRDHISSTVNTLFLAYAGAALPLLLLFTEARQPLNSIITREIVATEIVRSLVGSIGLVAAVPLTTWLAVRAASSALGPDGPVETTSGPGVSDAG